jgi:hypothetical protein
MASVYLDGMQELSTYTYQVASTTISVGAIMTLWVDPDYALDNIVAPVITIHG